MSVYPRTGTLLDASSLSSSSVWSVIFWGGLVAVGVALRGHVQAHSGVRVVLFPIAGPSFHPILVSQAEVAIKMLKLS